MSRRKQAKPQHLRTDGDASERGAMRDGGRRLKLTLADGFVLKPSETINDLPKTTQQQENNNDDDDNNTNNNNNDDDNNNTNNNDDDNNNNNDDNNNNTNTNNNNNTSVHLVNEAVGRFPTSFCLFTFKYILSFYVELNCNIESMLKFAGSAGVLFLTFDYNP